MSTTGTNAAANDTAAAAPAATNGAAPATNGELKARAKARPSTDTDGIRLSEKAAAQIQKILKDDNYPATMYLFVGVKGGGCSGLQYVLDLRDEAHAPINDMDEVFLSHDTLVVCDFKSYVVGNLTGTEIDYQDGLMGAGFTFNNPNAKHACGCGSSYSA